MTQRNLISISEKVPGKKKQQNRGFAFGKLKNNENNV